VSAAADHAGAGNISGSLSFTIWRTPSASTISMLMSPLLERQHFDLRSFAL
jgi:hypothetical protein